MDDWPSTASATTRRHALRARPDGLRRRRRARPVHLLDIVALLRQLHLHRAARPSPATASWSGADLFAGFSLSGFFENAPGQRHGRRRHRQRARRDAGYELLDGDYDSKFGVELEHDGGADNALISGLNITAGYEANYQTTGYSLTEIYAEADYTLNVAIVTLTPYVGYTMVMDGDTPANDYSEIVAGTGLMTPPSTSSCSPA